MSNSNILSALSDSNMAITLGLEIAGQLIPLGKGLVRSIKAIGAGSDTQTYELLISADAAELDAVANLALADLAAINAELAKLGKAPVIPIDSGSSAPPIVDSQSSEPASPAAPAQAGEANSATSSDAAGGSAPAPAGATPEVPAGGNSAAPDNRVWRGNHWAVPGEPEPAAAPATEPSKSS